MSQKNNKSRPQGQGGKNHNTQAKGSTKSGQQKKSAPPPPAPKKRTGLYIAIAAVILIGGIAIFGNGGRDSNPSSSVPTASAEEAKYIGRLLPDGYQEPTVAEATRYTLTVEMTELAATVTDTQVSVPVGDVAGAKIALFQYQPAGATQSLPLIAYVKPSGKLFVGVSFCPPCQGEWQTIQADGTLTCNSCGTKRDLETMVGISGSCKLYPLDELPVTIVDGNITVDRSVIDSWTPQPLDRQVG